LAKVLVEYHAENANKFEDEKGLMKVLEINTSSHHSDKLRKAAGQVKIKSQTKNIFLSKNYSLDSSSALANWTKSETL